MHIPRCYGRRAYRFKAWAMMALVHLQAMSLAGSYYYTPVSVTKKGDDETSKIQSLGEESESETDVDGSLGSKLPGGGSLGASGVWAKASQWDTGTGDVPVGALLPKKSLEACLWDH